VLHSPQDQHLSERLQPDEEHFRLALEAGEIGTWEWDIKSGRMIWSAQMCRNMGVDAASPADRFDALIEAIHPSDRDAARSAFGEFRIRPGPMRLELRLAQPADDPHWIVFLGNVIADAEGVPARILGITIDSTRRRRIEESAAAALRDSERRLRDLNDRLEHRAEERARELLVSRAQMQAIFDNSPDWLTLFRATRDGRFVYEDLNRATERAYGLTYDQVVGRTVEDILGLEQAQLPLRLMRECIATGENQRYVACRTLAGQTRTIDVMFVRVPSKVGDDPFIMATARDITEHEAREERLRQSQKIEALGQLTGGVAHDFNNLLTAIVGNLELIGLSLSANAPATRHIEAAQRAAANGAKLTEQLLAFSRRQHLAPRSVDLNAVIAGMRELLTRTLGAMVRVRTVLAPELWPAMVDPTQIEVAILNLAINARDAMPAGGTLIIETSNLPYADGAASPELAAQDCIRVSVRDTGIGMSEEVVRSAIEPFFTTKQPGKGSGLGLSQVYGMARQSNGALEIDSRPGGGTAVHIYLPRAVADAADAAALTSRAGRPATSGRILVVDDDPAVREVTSSMLRQSGYGVTEVESGEAALAALARGEPYDLLVVDMVMPGLAGTEMVRRARGRWPGLRVLFVTGYTQVEASNPTIADDPLIKKPFRLGDLCAAVAAAMQRNDPAQRDNVRMFPRR
jgi:PAS domain S-box-containing protein